MGEISYENVYEADREWINRFLLRERNSKKPESLKLGFVGVECYDIVILLARKCAEYLGKTAVVDLSTSKNVGKIFSDYYREVDILEAFEEKELEEYKLIIFYFGEGESKGVRLDELVCVTGMNVEDIMRLKNVRGFEIKRLSIIVRDYVEGKYTPGYIKEEIRNRIGYEGVIEAVDVLMLSAEDVLARSLLGREGDVNEKILSKDFRGLLERFYKKIAGEIRYRGNLSDSIVC